MSTIQNKTKAEVFRQRCEDKNTLDKKGSLYVGTGKHSGSGDGLIRTTVSTPPPKTTVF